MPKVQTGCIDANDRQQTAKATPMDRKVDDFAEDNAFRYLQLIALRRELGFGNDHHPEEKAATT